MTAEEKQVYIDDYKTVEGIQLSARDIKKNAGLYKMAKLYLNSLWGKFGQRLGEDFTTVDLIHDTADGALRLNKARADKTIKNIVIVDEKCIVITTQGKTVEKHVTSQTTNVALAIFTTAHARVKLYLDLLEPLQRKVMYYDTDSVIFKHKLSETKHLETIVPLGRYLGDLTSEIGDKYKYINDEYIIEFISGGPKNYGYRTNKLHEVAKIKGHRLQRRSVQDLLNYRTIKKTVFEKTTIVVDDSKIVRKPGFRIENLKSTKKYRYNFTKRKALPPTIVDGQVIQIETRPWLNRDRKKLKRN